MSDLIERLRAKARQVSEVHQNMAEAKSLRQESNTERRTDLYMWPTPEQTDEWKAADRIEQLSQSRSEVWREAVEAAAIKLDETIAGGYPTPVHKVDQCEHGKFGWEDCIACYDDELTKTLESIRTLSPPEDSK